MATFLASPGSRHLALHRRNVVARIRRIAREERPASKGRKKEDAGIGVNCQKWME